MKQQKPPIIYSAADIQKYLEGKLSAAEMHRIEKAALHDPLLADAIEGMEIGAADYREDVQRLREAVFQKRKRSIAILWRAAAIVVVIATVVALLLIRNQQPVQKDELAKATTMAKREDKVADTGASYAAGSVATRPPRRQSATPLQREYEKTAIDSALDISSEPEKQVVKSPLEALNGRVPGVVVQRADKEKKNETVLHPSDTKLNEVEVIAYGTTSNNFKKKSEELYNYNAQPRKGWKAYNRYLEKQKRKDSSDLLTKGIVVIRFNVDHNGNLSNFTVTKSLSPFYDQEAIRLIKEGPGWKVKQGERGFIELSVSLGVL